MIKLLKLFSYLCLFLAALGAVASVGIRVWAPNHSQRLQLAQKSAGGELFGDDWDKLGTPQTFVQPDKDAIKDTPKGFEVPVFDKGVLDSKHEYPLQLQTVTETTNMSLLGSGILAACGGGLMLLLRSRKHKS